MVDRITTLPRAKLGERVAILGSWSDMRAPTGERVVVDGPPLGS
jgi:hypothetical protein